MANKMMSSKGTLGILVGGGPAPGINGVIAAATIEAKNAGLNVIGIMDGFQWLEKGDTDHVRELEIRDVSRIHFTGGSILRTSRSNPTKNDKLFKNCLDSIRRLGLNFLITIGGDDTISAACKIARQTKHDLRIAHIPKTIDNDLPLPNNMPAFGYETARHVGVQLIQNIMEDSRTTNRWYIAVTMGLKAGHLTLGTCKAAGATLAIIGEEFKRERISLHDVCDVLEGAMIKRKAMGRDDGVALIAEGVATKFSEGELRNLPGINLEYDDYGNVRMAEIDLGRIIKSELERRSVLPRVTSQIVSINIGYELRCAAPIPFDCEYVRDLGYGAIQFLLSPEYERQSCALISVDAGKTVPINFEDLMDAQTGKTRIRYVDVNTDSYAVSQKYMIKLKKADFEEPKNLLRLAKAGEMTPEEFRDRFEYLVK